MKIFIIKQDVNNDCDTFDSAIVAAGSADAARLIHPSERYANTKWWTSRDMFGPLDSWALPEAVSVRLIGEADSDIKPGVILASFNAG